MSDPHFPLPSSPLQQPTHRTSSVQTRLSASEHHRASSLRHQSQGTMPDGNQSNQSASNKSHGLDARSGTQDSTSPTSRRASSSVSSRSYKQSPDPPPGDSNPPLTPEETPPFRPSRKRTAGAVEDEDKDLDSLEASPTHTRTNSGDSSLRVCICVPEPKIPRPRNAFILYRQHNQAFVVRDHPGLANPEISKIIGQQWQTSPPEVKNKWKAIAEEEKVRHQQLYPNYRYQPQRKGRRNSLNSDGSPPTERTCAKCGGKTTLPISVSQLPFQTTGSNTPASVPQTPKSSITTPVSRTVPALRDLSLYSPAARRMAQNYPFVPQGHGDERDEVGPMNGDFKRRRYNSEQRPSVHRMVPPRYAAAPPGTSVGPSTPFPFGQTASPPNPQHPYPPAVGDRRESLPGLRGMVSPQPSMAPPPRPSIGYAQHRLSQGHVHPDRSLTLPPLQTMATSPNPGSAVPTSANKSVKDQILSIDFRHRIGVLRQVAPPRSVHKFAPRGPLLAIEGDDAEAVADVAAWLRRALGEANDLCVQYIEGPAVSGKGSKEIVMAGYHRLCADWLLKSVDIKKALALRATSPVDTSMKDAESTTPTPRATNRLLDENYDSEEDSSPPSQAGDNDQTAKQKQAVPNTPVTEKMDVDRVAQSPGSNSKSPAPAPQSGKPVSVVANFTLYASTFYACHIPLAPGDPYSPQDHWSWTATHWRGVVSPDLTIYVRDMTAPESGRLAVEILEDRNLFVVKRTKVDGKEGLEIEPSVLRRLGFEVGEWVRAFGAREAE